MRKFICIQENGDPQQGILLEVLENFELEEIIRGDYYHDKISEKIEGFFLCLNHLEVDYEQVEFEIDDFCDFDFYSLEFKVERICWGETFALKGQTEDSFIRIGELELDFLTVGEEK